MSMSTRIASEEGDHLLLDTHWGSQVHNYDQDALSLLTISPSLTLRISAAMYSFSVIGLFQSSVGVMLQPLALHYTLSDLSVSLIFIAGPVAYVLAAQLSDSVHSVWGQRGIATLGPLLHILGALGIAAHPSFPCVLLAFAAVSAGTGLLDGSWCAWAASMHNANTVSGMLQGAYSVGAAAGPFLAGTVLPSWNRPWYDWGYFLVSASVVELYVLCFAFRHEKASKYQGEKLPATSRSQVMFRYPAVWLSALYFLTYMGIETTISGWVVQYMIRHRQATPYLASSVSTGFWAGMAAGRFGLGVLTDTLGVGRANIMYFIITIALQIVFAYVEGHTNSIVVMTFVGLFMGPMFASGIVLMTRLLPAKLHIAAVSFVASAGQVGAALLPFGIGALIQGTEIGIFRFAVIFITVLAFMAWIPVSRLQRKTSRYPPPVEGHDRED